MNLFGNISIGKRLGLGFTVILLGAAIIAGIAVTRLATMANTTRTMMAEPLFKERLASDWYRTIYASIRRNTAVAKSSDVNLASYFAQENADASKYSLEHKKTLEPLLRTEAEKQVFARLLDVRQQFVATRDAITAAKLAGRFDEADKILATDFTTAANGYQQALNDLLKLQRDNLNQLAADIQENEAQSRYFFIGLSAILLALGALLAWRISASITTPLHRAVGVAETVAAGDLSTTIVSTTTDETGKLLQALSTMNDNLLSVVKKIRHGTDTIHTASSELAHGNLDLSSRTEQQASSLEETASAMEELTTTVKQNADNAKQANQLAASASHIATEGGNVVDKVIHTMNDIHDASKKIVDIISVIDGIAFQTNILALNAAVEAARAGEQGRGFAVVASEVRSLAQRSASAAKEIKQLIDDSVSKVDTGSQYVDEAGQTMQHVVASIRRVTDIVAEISAASQEQSAGIEQVNQAIAQMDEVTQQNAALVEQATAATQSMQIEATALANIVNTFKVSNVDAPITTTVAKTPTFNHSPVAVKRNKVSITPARQPAKLPASISESNDWEEF